MAKIKTSTNTAGLPITITKFYICLFFVRGTSEIQKREKFWLKTGTVAGISHDKECIFEALCKVFDDISITHLRR